MTLARKKADADNSATMNIDVQNRTPDISNMLENQGQNNTDVHNQTPMRIIPHQLGSKTTEPNLSATHADSFISWAIETSRRRDVLPWTFHADMAEP